MESAHRPPDIPDRRARLIEQRSNERLDRPAAGPGEVIFLTKGTEVTYQAEVATLVVGATYPHWQDAQRRSHHAHMLDDFHPVQLEEVP